MEKGDLELPEIDDDLEFSDDENFVDDSDEENN